MSDRLLIVTGSPAPEVRVRIEDAASGMRIVYPASPEQLREHLPEAEAVAGTLTGADVARATRLRWIHSPAAGANADLSPELLERTDVTLTSSSGNGAIPLAEHSMLLMMMLNRDVPRWAAAQRERRWDRFVHGELTGLTLGIVGLGNAGTDLATKAKAFHMRVLGVRRHTDRPVDGVDRTYPPADLHEFLGECDFVVVTAPLTPDTAGLFDADAFRAMRRTAYWICISRGGIADDDALLTALREGWIAGAGLDAHGVEPLPADSPFWDLPNVIVTPHNGATTAATAARSVDILVDNIGRYIAGEPLHNVVDKLAGY
jgi:phosphoglycerate dehydrogenase-like enzyme